MKKYWKRLRNHRGFTLVEMMMVVAVIGILAAVLVPKMSGVKDNAKLAGVDANVRQVQAAVIPLIQRYQSGAVAATVSQSIANACDAIENPFTNDTGANVAATAETFDDTISTAVTVDSASGGDAPAYASGNPAIGMIFVTYTIASGAVTDITITPYDNKGYPMAATTVLP